MSLHLVMKKLRAGYKNAMMKPQEGPRMTLNQIHYFIKLAECLSFTEAAKCLFITQPALSRQIAVMEQELGTPLFVRDKKRLKLTPGGLVLYNRLPEIVHAYEEAVAEAGSANQGFEGTLRIGILDIYDIAGSVTDMIRLFQTGHPEIDLTLERFSLGALPKKLYQNQLDLILTYQFSLYDQPDLLTAFLHHFNSSILLNRHHPLARDQSVTLSDLRDETFVQLSQQVNKEGHQYLLHLYDRAGFVPNIRFVDKMEDVLLWVQSGSGVAITSDHSTERYHPDVVVCPIDMPEAKNHEVCLAWHRSNYNPAIALFTELTEQFAQDDAERSAGKTRYAAKARTKQRKQ